MGAVVDATAADVAFLKACKLVGAKTNMQSAVQVRKRFCPGLLCTSRSFATP